MRVNYVLMYGTPYLKYREFETFEDISKFLVNKSIVNYSIFKKLEDKEEVEMIYRDNDIRYLEKELDKYKTTIDKIKEYCNHKLEMLELQKRNIMQILTPENGYLKTDIEIEMQKYEDILKLLEEIE